MKQKMKQSTLSKIIGLGSIVLILLTAAILLGNFSLVKRVNQANQDRYDLTAQATRLKNTSGFLTDEVRAYAANGVQKNYDNYWNEVNNLKNRESAIANMKEIGITPEEAAKIESIGNLSNSLIPLEEQAMADVAAKNLPAALKMVYGEDYNNGVANVTILTEEFLGMLDARTAGALNQLAQLQLLLSVISMTSVTVLLLFQILYLAFVRKQILNPVIKLSQNMQDVSIGVLSTPLDLEPDTSEIGILTDSVLRTKSTLTSYVNEISALLRGIADNHLDYTIQRDYVGDFAAIKESFLLIARNLNQTMYRIDQTARQVSSGSDQVSSGAQTLSRGATEQASAIEELTASIETISSQVSDNAKSAVEASRRASVAGEEVENSNRQMREMITAIGEISSSSQEIGKIIKAIEDIAFQTNILALNAAVEAARAGAAGKGFAVVADEVRNLAGKSAEAAKTTTSLIEGSVKSVENGTRIADSTAKSLLSVVSGVQEVVDSVNKISIASSEQARSIEEVTLGLGQISGVIQANSATAEESAAASEELSSQAQILKSLVDQFTLSSAAQEDQRVTVTL